jgi:glycosyltransferase involved in cell wall biosynthesis
MDRTSILINNYNNARFLAQCVDSALNQTIQPGEIVVYDDGSTDGSLELLKRYGSALTVLRGARGQSTPMANQAVAIQNAFAVSKGDIIFLLDADDAFSADKISSYLAAFNHSSKIIMVQAPMWKIDDSGQILGVEYDPRRHAKDYLKYIYESNDINIYYPTSALAFRRSYLEKRFPLDFSDGRPLWPDGRLSLVAAHFGEIVTLDEPHTLWRRHPRSHTVITKTSVYQQAKMNVRYYNAFCASRGWRPIYPWRSAQQRRRWLRHVCPQFFLDLYQAYIRRATLPGKAFPSSGASEKETS